VTESKRASRFDSDREALPWMTISLLGASKSGKSCYILGMFAALVRGQAYHQYSLSTANHEDGIAMLQELEDLGAGKPPLGTDEPKTHKFTLRGGLPGRGPAGGVQTGVIAIDLTDFRGGAIREQPLDDNDTEQYYAQLLRSDSIFVVLDSGHFRQPVTPAREHAVIRDTWANRIGDLIGWTLREREARGLPAPSIAVLLTKWDFLNDQRGTAARGLAEVYGDVRALLPRVFGVGLEQYVFGVSIGEFSDPEGNPRQAHIGLSGVENPLFFATGCFLANQTQSLQGERGHLEADRAAAAARLAKLTRWPPIVQQYLLQTPIEERRATLNAKDAALAAHDLRASQVAEHEKVLRGLAT
jgi:hypothetical protein